MRKLLIVAVFLTACSTGPVLDSPETTNTPVNPEIQKTVIATSTYPVQYLLEQMATEDMEIVNILPAGQNHHTFSPSARDLVSIAKADLFVYQSADLQPWVLDVEAQKKLELNEDLQLIEAEEDEHEDDEHKDDEHKDDEHGHGEYDPHTWTSPKQLMLMSEQIAKELDLNSDKLLSDLSQIDQLYQNLSQCPISDALVSHAAFDYLGRDYGITFHSVHGLSHLDEPSAKEISELIKEAKELGLSHMFFEPDHNPLAAQTIAEETGLEVLMLNPGISNTEGDLLAIMQENYQNLRTALNCQ